MRPSEFAPGPYAFEDPSEAALERRIAALAGRAASIEPEDGLRFATRWRDSLDHERVAVVTLGPTPGLARSGGLSGAWVGRFDGDRLGADGFLLGDYDARERRFEGFWARREAGEGRRWGEVSFYLVEDLHRFTGWWSFGRGVENWRWTGRAQADVSGRALAS